MFPSGSSSARIGDPGLAQQSLFRGPLIEDFSGRRVSLRFDWEAAE
jgi:hypothetical protein